MFTDITNFEAIVLFILLSIIVICAIGLAVNEIQLHSKRYWKRWEKKYMKKNGMNQYWDIFIKHWEEFKPYAYGDKGIFFNWNNRYDIAVWKINGKYETSVHVYDRSDCVLCGFNKEKSEKLAKLLVEKWNNYFVNYNI